jgi:hypothetical protein
MRFEQLLPLRGDDVPRPNAHGAEVLIPERLSERSDFGC